MVRAGLIGAAYFGLAELGFALPLEGPGTAAFWLGAGLSLGILAGLPPRRWLPTLTAVFCACMLTNLRHGIGLPLSLSFSTTNVIEPALGAWVLRRWIFGGEDRPLVGSALALVLAGSVAALLGAALGTSALLATGQIDAWLSTFTHWFVEDWLGILVVAPLIFSWWSRPKWSIGPTGWGFRVGLVLLLGATSVSGILTFWVATGYGTSLVALYAQLALLLFGTVTVGLRGATLAVLILALLGAYGTLYGYGPFVHVGASMTERVTALQGYLVVTALVGLLPAVLLGDRTRVVSRLRRQEREVEAIFQSLGEALIVTDATSLVIYVNRACASLIGVERDELLGRAFAEVLAIETMAEDGDEDIASMVLQRHELVRSPESRRLLRPDGAEVWTTATGAPLLDDDGRTCGAAVILTDETARRAHAVRLTEAERRLAHAQRVRAVGELAAGVAHDFNNLLTIIYASAGLLIEELPEHDRDLAEHIVDACERAQKLTARLSVLSRDDAEDLRRVELNEVVVPLRDIVTRLIGATIELKITPSPTPEPVFADPSRLEQVLLNLVINARDAMANGGALELRVTHRAIEAPSAGLEPGEFAVVEVRDTGHGMDKTTERRIFEPFFSTKPAGAGTGLGLATAQTICARHRGFLDVVTEPGKGATFRTHLPRLDEANTAATPSRVDVARGAGQHVLVVEDNIEVRESVRRILLSAGFYVTVVEQPSQALELLEQRAFDLLLTDVIMPEMNGRELAERALELVPTQQILFMTGYSAGILGQRVGGLERHVVIRKPFTATELARAILDQLAPSEAAHE